MSELETIIPQPIIRAKPPKSKKYETTKTKEINKRSIIELGMTVEERSTLNMIHFFREELLGIHKTGKPTSDKTINRTLRRLELIKFTYNKGFHLTTLPLKLLNLQPTTEDTSQSP